MIEQAPVGGVEATLLREALEHAPVGVGLWDAQLRYQWVNPALAAINGVPAAEHVGRTIGEVLPGIPADVIARYAAVLESGVPVSGVLVEGVTPASGDATRVWSVSIFRTTGPDGRPDGIASIIEDVTALRDARAESAELQGALALERQVLEEVVERVPLGVALLWGRELRYRVMNERGRRMLPDRGPLVGRTPAEVYPETAGVFAETILPLFDSGEQLVIREYPLPFDDDPGAIDGYRYYDVTFTPIRLGEGEVVGMLVAYLDVTDELGRRRTLERKLAEERRLSDTLQRALLPRRLPEIPHVTVAARYQPAGERFDVGGDFFDLFPGRGGAWVAVVGDVCGKGPRAAARTSMARYCLRAEAVHAEDPATLLTLLNGDVRRELDQEGDEDFVTLVLCVLRPAAAGTELLVATAGHPPAIIAAPGGSWRALGSPALPVGVASAPRYEQHADILRPGERLALYTDGLLDAHAPQRVLTAADLAQRATIDGGPEQVADALLEHVTSSPTAARDDCALLVLQQLPA